jgi:beta-glucosidase
MDNSAWQHGYCQRFGLMRVDHATQLRTVKDSGRWCAAVAGDGVS